MIGDLQSIEVGRGIKPMLAGMLEEMEKGLVKAFGVHDPDRLLVLLEFEPGHLLEKFLVGPNPAGEGDEGVGEFAHERLALVHRVDQVKIGEAGMHHFKTVHEMGDNTGNGSAGLKAGIGDGAHEAGSAATIDEGEPTLAEKVAGLEGHFLEGGMVAVARTTEDTYAVHPEQKEVC